MFLTLWATPRSTSTAFEWMMRQRGDFRCYHEPFNEAFYYGEDRRSERDAHVAARPGHTFATVRDGLFAQAADHDVFVKDFAYSAEHLMDDAFLDAMTHTFLIRDPRRVVQGLGHHWPDCTFEEVGFAALHRLFDRVTERDGRPPVVITSDDLVTDAATTIRAYCAAVGIAFMEDALAWDTGTRAEVSWYGEGSGPWHDSLRDSTGIAPPTTKYPPLTDDPRLLNLSDRSLPHHEALLAHRLPINR